MEKRFLLAGLVLLLAFSLFAAGGKETAAPTAAPTVAQEEDWDAIYEAAKLEGKVVIYSLSSRIFDAVEEFKTLYPGVEVEATDIPTVEQIEKIKREQQAGVYNADVLHLADETSIMYDLLKKNYVVNYVPQTLIDGVKTADVVPAKYREPMLLQSVEAKVIFYNTEVNASSPVDSLWDFTRPEWKGRFQMKDPMAAAENMTLFVMAVKYADDMAAAYQKEFGTKLVLSPGNENAGYEWIDRIIKNGLVLTSSDGTVSDAVGTPGQTNPPLGLCVASSKLRNNSKGQVLGIAWNVAPRYGTYKGNYLVMANNAPHPNAAKLLIRYMMGDAAGGKGMAPFYVPGQWSARSDVPPTADITLEGLDKVGWGPDPEYVYDNGLVVRDYWLTRE